MAAPRRVTLKEAGALDFVLQPLQVRHLELNDNFELKIALINLLPKFHGLSAQDPIRHLGTSKVYVLLIGGKVPMKLLYSCMFFPSLLRGELKSGSTLCPMRLLAIGTYLEGNS
ncbi:hypothetical protein AHAS_Ahas02G0164200 [Arachis hypogaea]